MKLHAAVWLLCVSMPALAAEPVVKLDHVVINLDDKAALRRGAQVFVDYCLNCHGASAMRFSRVGADLGMTDEQVAGELIHTGAKVGDTMTVALDRQDAKRWFGTPPPDLSVIARSRGPDWLYTYLRSFYRDESRPWGVNNAVFKDVAMPHVLWELQGLQDPAFRSYVGPDGKGRVMLEGLVLVESGKLSPSEFDAAVADLVNFLVYLGEPAKLTRYRVGLGVLAFLAVFFVVVYLLKREYWKDIH